MGGKTVTEHVRGDALAQAAALPGFAADGLYGSRRQVKVRPPGGEQPGAGWAQDAAVAAKNLQQARREHGVAILAPLAVLDADEHAAAVDVGYFQGHRFGDA